MQTTRKGTIMVEFKAQSHHLPVDNNNLRSENLVSDIKGGT
jgi:hypothetical protein